MGWHLIWIGSAFLLIYFVVAWGALALLAIGEIRAARRDELAAAVTTALLWPVSFGVLIALIVSDALRARWRSRKNKRYADA